MGQSLCVLLSQGQYAEPALQRQSRGWVTEGSYLDDPKKKCKNFRRLSESCPQWRWQAVSAGTVLAAPTVLGTLSHDASEAWVSVHYAPAEMTLRALTSQCAGL